MEPTQCHPNHKHMGVPYRDEPITTVVETEEHHRIRLPVPELVVMKDRKTAKLIVTEEMIGQVLDHQV